MEKAEGYLSITRRYQQRRAELDTQANTPEKCREHEFNEVSGKGPVGDGQPSRLEPPPQTRGG